MLRAVASIFQATQVRAFAAAAATKSSPLAGLLARRRSKANAASLRVRLTKVRLFYIMQLLRRPQPPINLSCATP